MVGPHLASTGLRALTLFAFSTLVSTSGQLNAADEFSDIKVVRSLPSKSSDLESLHRNSSGNQCEPIADGQSLETTTFGIIKTARESLDKNPQPAVRQSIISVGLTMDNSDKSDLPTPIRGKILEYMEDHYVSIQVRVRRDLVSNKLFFHHRPLAATANFRGSKVTQPFEHLVTTAVRDFRSVGLFSKVREDRKPEDLRTLVLIFKNTVIKSGTRTGSQIEYAFIRGREGNKPDRLTNHVFVTSNDRTQLVYLNPYARPSRPDDCSIRGSIVITEFDKLFYPKESATRSYRLDAKRIFPMENIDAYCKKHDLDGGIYENLDTVLDVLIDQMAAK